MIIIPFYTDAKFLNLFLSYISSFFWFLMIGMIGLKSGMAFFLAAFYFTISFVYHSFGIDSNAILGSLIGIVSALMLYFSRGMDIE